MTHEDLVQRAVIWLRRHHHCKTVFAEMVTSGSWETPDAIGWREGQAHVVECKTSRSDFHRDRKKPHRRDASWAMGTWRWYLTPPDLVKADEVPEGHGLVYAQSRRIEIIVPAPHREVQGIGAKHESLLLLSALRRLELGSRFDRKKARWEPVLEREARELEEKKAQESKERP